MLHSNGAQIMGAATVPFRSVRFIACLAILLLANCCGSYVNLCLRILKLNQLLAWECLKLKRDKPPQTVNGNFLILNPKS
jgi:hypothetical protein